MAVMLDVEARSNEAVLRYLRGRGRGMEAHTPPEAHADPYMTLGSHPDVVEWLWVKLGSALPEDARAVVYGTPALVHAKVGVVLGFTLGTAYVLRIPQDVREEAEAAGCASTRTWSDGSSIDLADAIDASWYFGAYDRREPEWIRRAHDAFSRPSL